MNEKDIDQKLNIHTSGIVQYYSDYHHNRYEPTPYKVLDEIIKLKLIQPDDTLLDVGCGKGRVSFYLSAMTHCHSIGLEYNHEIYLEALENMKSSKIDHVEIVNEDASLYQIPTSVNHVYFFNPFSLEILQKFLYSLSVSYYDLYRDIYLYFYYPTDEYVHYLNNHHLLTFYKSISTKYINPIDHNERILIYKIH